MIPKRHSLVTAFIRPTGYKQVKILFHHSASTDHRPAARSDHTPQPPSSAPTPISITMNTGSRSMPLSEPPPNRLRSDPPRISSDAPPEPNPYSGFPACHYLKDSYCNTPRKGARQSFPNADSKIIFCLRKGNIHEKNLIPVGRSLSLSLHP